MALRLSEGLGITARLEQVEVVRNVNTTRPAGLQCAGDPRMKCLARADADSLEV